MPAHYRQCPATGPAAGRRRRSGRERAGLISTSTGIKHEVTTRAAFLERLANAIDLIVC
jgi:hypothetical protein